MFDWLKRLIGTFDRQQAAADRAAVALEAIADDLETLRDGLNAHLAGTLPDSTTRRGKLTVRHGQ